MDIGKEVLKCTKIGRARPFFQKKSEESDKKVMYKCSLCPDDEILLNGTKEYNLLSHLKARHLDVYNSEIEFKGTPLYYATQRLKLLQRCVEIVTINKQPFNDLLKSGFQGIIASKLNKLSLAGFGINLTSKDLSPVKQHIRIVADKIREHIKNEVANECVSVMADIGSKNRRSIFGISIQYIVDGSLKSRSIGMIKLEESHTGVYLCQVLLKAAKALGISLAQIISLTVDNASNMMKMVKDVNAAIDDELEETDVEVDNSESGARAPMNENKAVNKSIAPTSSMPMETDTSTDGPQCDKWNECDQAFYDFEIADLLNNTDAADEDAIDFLLEESNAHDTLLNDLVKIYTEKQGTSLIYVDGLSCAAHTLQLAVREGVSKLEESHSNVISLCRKAAHQLRTQNCIYEMEKEKLKMKFPRLDVPTRWSSTYYLVSLISLIIINSLKTTFNAR